MDIGYRWCDGRWEFSMPSLRPGEKVRISRVKKKTIPSDSIVRFYEKVRLRGHDKAADSLEQRYDFEAYYRQLELEKASFVVYGKESRGYSEWAGTASSKDTVMKRTHVTVDGVTLSRSQVEAAYEELQKPQFKIGDLVSAYGKQGVVIDIGGTYAKRESVADLLRRAYGTPSKDQVRVLLIDSGESNTVPATAVVLLSSLVPNNRG